jgi:hypothetical protein
LSIVLMCMSTFKHKRAMSLRVSQHHD